MKKSLLTAGALAIAVSGTVWAASTVSDDGVAKLLKARLPKTEVSKVDCAKVPGICEVQAGASQLFYTDTTARYLIIGRVYDMETRQDLTAARLLELNPDMLVGGAASAAAKPDTADAVPPQGQPQAGRGLKQAVAQKVSLAGLPKNGAIEWGSGGPSVTIFSDFRCGYCKLLHQQLQTMNVKVYERPISVLGTRQISNAVICSDDKRGAVAKAYEGKELASGKCDTTGLDANEKFARDNGFDGTPVLVRSDGAVLQGFRPKAFLETWLKGGNS